MAVLRQPNRRRLLRSQALAEGVGRDSFVEERVSLKMADCFHSLSYGRWQGHPARDEKQRRTSPKCNLLRQKQTACQRSGRTTLIPNLLPPAGEGVKPRSSRRLLAVPSLPSSSACGRSQYRRFGCRRTAKLRALTCGGCLNGALQRAMRWYGRLPPPAERTGRQGRTSSNQQQGVGSRIKRHLVPKWSF